MINTIKSINNMANLFVRLAIKIHLNNRDIFKLKKDLSSYYGVDPNFPHRDIQDFKSRLKDLLKSNGILMIEDEFNPNIIHLGLKNFGDLPPVIIKGNHILIKEEQKEGERKKFSAELIGRSYRHR